MPERSIISIGPPPSLSSEERRFIYEPTIDKPFILRLEKETIFSSEAERAERLNKCVDGWLRCVTPGEDRNVLIRFFDKFLTREAYDGRVNACYTAERARLFRSCVEPIAIALGLREQSFRLKLVRAYETGVAEEYERLLSIAPYHSLILLGAWLEQVILESNTDALKDLIKALELLPKQPWSCDKVEDIELSLCWNSNSPNSLKVYNAFRKLLKEKGRIPWKQEVGEEAEIDEPSRLSEAMKVVGLQGIRSGKPPTKETGRKGSGGYAAILDDLDDF